MDDEQIERLFIDKYGDSVQKFHSEVRPRCECHECTQARAGASSAPHKRRWTLFGNELRWSDPEQEAFKRRLKAEYGWGAPKSIWTIKFMLIAAYIVLIGLGIDYAVLKALGDLPSWLMK